MRNLAGRDSESSLEVGCGVALAVDEANPGTKNLLGFLIKPFRDVARSEEVHLLNGGERRDDGRKRVSVSLGLRLAHTREHRELGCNACGVGRNVPGEVRHDLAIVDSALVEVAAKIRCTQKLEPPAKA